jgi:deoxyribose-phosphate aldolase
MPSQARHKRPSRQPAAPPWREVARLLDHTLLRPEATASQIAELCTDARHFRVAAVCVNPAHVALAAARLRKSSVAVATVVGFPLGASLSTTKAFEAREAIRLGATELDMVLNVGALKAGERKLVRDDIRAVTRPAHAAGVLVKVILETVLLSDAEKVLACELALEAGADFVKTSTGFGGGGATVADVALMRRTVGNRAGVKAAGGIRTAADVAAMVEAGASRIGTSSSAAILRELGAPARGKKA